MNVFTNFTLKKSITSSLNGIVFSLLVGFCMMVDSNTSYYIIDTWANHILILDINYGYVVNKGFTAPFNMVAINSNLYITGTSNIWKTDKYLNVLLTHSESGTYRGIFFNSTENCIYVASEGYTYFQVLILSFNLKYNVSVSPKTPRSFAEYNKELYVGTSQGLIDVIVNKVVVRSFTGCAGKLISSIVSDACGYIALSCESKNSVYLYYYNGTITSKSLATGTSPEYIAFDSKKYFVELSGTEIRIYIYIY
jgi:hypothetical protein